MILFPFRRQPLKNLYHVYILLSLPVRLPLWALLSAVPAWRPRRSWSWKRSFWVHVLKLIVHVGYMTDPDFTRIDVGKKAEEADRVGFVWIDALPKELIVGEVAAAARLNRVASVAVPGYWHGKRGESGAYGQPAAPNEKVLYVLHGGAYIGGSGTPDGVGVPTIVDGIFTHSSGAFSRALALDYRLSSTTPLPVENPFPAALLDAVAGYRYLVSTLGFSPGNIVVEGDSAGGHLAVALARYLIQLNAQALPVPGALLLLSPTADWGCTHDTTENCSMEHNYSSDFVYEMLKTGYTARALTGLLPQDEIHKNAYLSPASLKITRPVGFFKGLPKTCIIAGSAEQTLDGMVTLHNRLVQDIGAQQVRYLLYEDATHDFLGFAWHEPERSQALHDIEEWLKLEVFPRIASASVSSPSPISAA